MAFTISFPLILEKWQEDYLDKKLYIMARYYNELAFELNKRLSDMKRDKDYISEVERIKLLDTTEAKKIALYKKNKSNVIKKYEATPEGIRKTLGMELLKKRPQYKHYLLTVEISQTITRGALDKAYKSGTIHYKKRNEGLDSFVTQIPLSSPGSIKLNPITREMEIGSPNTAKIIRCKFKVHNNDNYAYDVLSQIKQSKSGWIANESSGMIRIKRKQRKGKNYFYVEIVLKDTVSKPKTHQPIAKGNKVGVDIGATTVAWWDGQEARQEQLGSAVKLIQDAKNTQRILQRKADRQRRAGNPDNYNENGTIKAGPKKWSHSRNYLKTQGELKNISHKIAAQRKELLNKLANDIINSGDHILVEKMDWKKIAKNTETVINPDTGRYMPKKKFGKLVGENAPATLTETLRQKLAYIDGIYEEVNTYDTALSQLNHITGEYTKKDLSQRETLVGGHLVGRDTYASLGIRNVDTSGKKHQVNIEGMNRDWGNFLDAEEYRYKDVKFRIEQGESLSRAMIPDSLVRTRS